MRIYVTGGSGYIGQALCRRLVAGGHEVRSLVRPTSDTTVLRELGVATFPGDITDRATLREGMSGADWVVHAAAELDPRAPAERMEAVNVGGSENVASLAYKLGVGRLLSVSSMAYFGGSPPDGRPGDESSPVRRPFPSAYSATKHAGEEAIRRWAAQGLGVNSVFPSLVYGPPGKKEGVNVFLRRLLQGRFPVMAGAGRRSSWVYIDDVVDAIARVMERAEPGRGYLLAGEAATLREVAERACRLAGVPPPRLWIPVGAAAAAARLLAPFDRLRGRRPRVSAAQLESLRRHWVFDDSRARRELGWAPRTLAEGLPPTVEFLMRG